eukprot:134387_1
MFPIQNTHMDNASVIKRMQQQIQQLKSAFLYTVKMHQLSRHINMNQNQQHYYDINASNTINGENIQHINNIHHINYVNNIGQCDTMQSCLQYGSNNINTSNNMNGSDINRANMNRSNMNGSNTNTSNMNVNHNTQNISNHSTIDIDINAEFIVKKKPKKCKQRFMLKKLGFPKLGLQIRNDEETKLKKVHFTFFPQEKSITQQVKQVDTLKCQRMSISEQIETCYAEIGYILLMKKQLLICLVHQLKVKNHYLNKKKEKEYTSIFHT